MNLKEYSEQEGITMIEAKIKTGLTHWKQDVPGTEGIEPSQNEAQVPPAVSVPVPPAVYDAAPKRDGLTVSHARSVRGRLGDKDRDFLKLVREHQTDIPEEYERVKGLIARYL